MAISALGLMIIFGMISSFEAGFAPNPREEKYLTRCLLLQGLSEDQCFGRFIHPSPTRRKRGAILTDPLLDSANDYIIALTNYEDMVVRHEGNSNRPSVSEFMSAPGSCAKNFKSVSRTWRKLLHSRGPVARLVKPEEQTRNGTTISVRFSADSVDNSYSSSASTLRSVDLIVGRSHENDTEVYGKYVLRANIKRTDGDRLEVHDTVQGTCPSSENRYFVAGLNEDGIEAINAWISKGNESIEFLIEVIPQSHIIRDTELGMNYIEQHVDIQQTVSAMVLHYERSTGQIVPYSNGIFLRSEDKDVRRKRSPSDSAEGPCKLERYNVDYRNNPKVVRPLEYNVGECAGSCENAQLSHLNATSHAITLLLDKPEQNFRVCCAPISFKRLYFIILDENGLMMSDYVDNMVAEYCGCR